MGADPKPKLVVEAGVDKGLEFPLSREMTSLGRSAQNDIQIIDKRMSRRHVEFLWDGGSAILRDLGSKNGTWLNSNRVTGEHPLHHGDKVRIGETVLRFDLAKPQGPIRRVGEEPPDNTARMVAQDWTDNAQHSQSIAAGAAPLELDRLAEAGQRYKRQQAAGAGPGPLGQAPGPSAAALDKARARLLIEVADAIRTILDMDELLERLMDLIWSAVDPDTGVLLMVDEKTNRFFPKVARDGRDREGEEDFDPAGGGLPPGMAVSRAIIDRASRERVSLLISDAERDERFNASASVIMHQIRSAICAPVIHKEQVLGAIYISSQKHMSFTQADLEVITGIANQAAMAIASARLHAQVVEQEKSERELEIARDIQANLLPKATPDFQNFEVAGMSLPAKHVGGDYYDYAPAGEGRWAIAVADVSGKGVPAALLTTAARASMHVLAERGAVEPPEMVGALNAAVCRDSLNNMFVTMFYCLVDDAKREVLFTNAGHAHPMLFSAEGAETPLITGGSFLGIDDEMEFDAETVRMEPGSALILYTDGVTDATDADEQQFGSERLRGVIREHLAESAERMRDAIHEATLEFRGEAPQFDDFTLIVLKCVQ